MHDCATAVIEQHGRTAIAQGYAAVQDLQRDMNENRQTRLARLHFSAAESETLSTLHTRNFM